MPSKKYEIRLSQQAREHLMRISSAGRNTPQAIKNALVLLGVDRGRAAGRHHTDESIADILDIDRSRIYRVKRDYLRGSIDTALIGEISRRGHRRRSLDTSQVKELLAIYDESPPDGASRWSAMALATELAKRGIVQSVSRSTVSKTLRENGVWLMKTYSKK